MGLFFLIFEMVLNFVGEFIGNRDFAHCLPIFLCLVGDEVDVIVVTAKDIVFVCGGHVIG